MRTGYWNGADALVLAALLALCVAAARFRLKTAPVVAVLMLYPLIAGYMKRAPSIPAAEKDFYADEANAKAKRRAR